MNKMNGKNGLPQSAKKPQPNTVQPSKNFLARRGTSGTSASNTYSAWKWKQNNPPQDTVTTWTGLTSPAVLSVIHLALSSAEKSPKKMNPEMTTKIKIEHSMTDCNVIKLLKLRGPRVNVTEDRKRSKKCKQSLGLKCDYKQLPK